jgi:hypothetical protein
LKQLKTQITFKGKFSTGALPLPNDNQEVVPKLPVFVSWYALPATKDVGLIYQTFCRSDPKFVDEKRRLMASCVRVLRLAL